MSKEKEDLIKQLDATIKDLEMKVRKTRDLIFVISNSDPQTDEEFKELSERINGLMR
jgi:archaellum component FlaC